MVGSSLLDDFVVKRVPKNLAHRLRMRPLSLGSVPSSSRMNCSLSRLSTVHPHRALLVFVETPLVVIGEQHLRFSKALLEVGVHQSPLADSRTPSSASFTRFCPS